MDKKARLFRRFMHCLLAVAPLYYLLPVELPGLGVRRWVVLVGFFVIVASIETVRLLRGWTFMGLRPHERSQISSFAWAAAGVTAALWLFREDVASAAIVGMAFVDPLAGELRQARRARAVTIGVPVVAYVAIAATILHVFGTMSIPMVALVSVVGAVAAVGIERQKVPYLDDDFLMILLPCLVMQVLAY